MELARSDSPITPVGRRLLLADSAFEAVAAVILSGLVGPAHWWLNVERPATLTAALVFAVAAVVLAVAAFLKRTNEGFLRSLAFANLAGGAAIWVGALLTWTRFESEGRWLVAAIADGFLAIGALEYFEVRQKLRKR